MHEPFAPSAAAAALRHSRALNVGSFHSPTERVLSTQVARRFIELFFGRLDARTGDLRGHARADLELLPGRLRGRAAGGRPGALRARPIGRAGPLEIAFVLDEERASLRLFLRALRRLPLDREWTATIWSPASVDLPARLAGALRERVRLSGPRREPLEALLARADALCAASAGIAPRTTTLMKAIATGAVPVASRIPVYEEVLHDGAEGLLFEPGDAEVLGAQLARLVTNRDLLLDLRRRCLARRRGDRMGPRGRRDRAHLQARDRSPPPPAARPARDRAAIEHA